MKTKFFLWAGIFSLLLTACGNDDNGDDPTTSLNDSKLVFTKMANCPVSAELHSTVYNGLIYFNSGAGDFISYNPARNEWKTLARTPASYYFNLFVWQGKLYWHGGSPNDNVRIYRPESDSWSETDEFAPHDRYGMVYNIGNKIFLLFGPDHICKTYQFDTQDWKDLDDRTIAYCTFCTIENLAYGIFDNTIYQFDPETYIATPKVNIPGGNYNRSTLAVCPYKEQQMLYIWSCTYGAGSIFARVGIYTPSTNDYIEKDFSTHPVQGSSEAKADIPMVINKLTYVDGRVFAGPNNAAFYELKIK